MNQNTKNLTSPHEDHSNYYQWENPTNDRYYLAAITKDLLDDWVVMQAWGKKNTHYGRVLYTACNSYEQACDVLSSIASVRLKRGYKPCLMKI
jgi:hypothetical protein